LPSYRVPAIASPHHGGCNAVGTLKPFGEFLHLSTGETLRYRMVRIPSDAGITRPIIFQPYGAGIGTVILTYGDFFHCQL